jgi:hypothetical protein
MKVSGGWTLQALPSDPDSNTLLRHYIQKVDDEQLGLKDSRTTIDMRDTTETEVRDLEKRERTKRKKYYHGH